MTEDAPKSPEHFSIPTNHSETENSINFENPNKKNETIEHNPKKQIEQIRSNASREALSGKEYSRSEHHKKDIKSIKINKQTKRAAYMRSLHRAQTHLSQKERTFSRIVHRPTIEKISNIASQTIARSSGLLFGSIFAFAGTILFVWFSRRFGIQYNYFIMILLFCGGYLVGVLVEFAWRLFKPWKTKY